MPRTCQRPVAAGRIPASWALALGIVLNVIALAFIGATTNWLAACWPSPGRSGSLRLHALAQAPHRSQHRGRGLAGSFPPWSAGRRSRAASGQRPGVRRRHLPLDTTAFWALATLVERDTSRPVSRCFRRGRPPGRSGHAGVAVATVIVSVARPSRRSRDLVSRYRPGAVPGSSRRSVISNLRGPPPPEGIRHVFGYLGCGSSPRLDSVVS